MANLNRAEEEVIISLLEPAEDTSKSETASQSKPSRLRRSRSSVPYEFHNPSSNPEPLIWATSKHPFRLTNRRFIQIALLFVIYLLVSSTCFYFVKDQIDGEHTNPILDAIYFTFMILTGYGDLVPNSDLTKLLAVAFAFLGMAVVGLLLSEAADQLVEKQAFLFEALNMPKEGGNAKMLKEIETNKAKHKFYTTTVVLVLLLAMGTIFLWKVERLNLVDSLYCACATLTTLGCQEKSFSSSGGRVFAVFWILVSTLYMAQYFVYLAEWRTEHKQKKLIEWVRTRRLTNNDLLAADLDCDGVISASEFILYKLKEMEKITEEDVALLLRMFRNDDVDNSGKLTLPDINMAD